MLGIPFIGQEGFYPSWIKGAGRWVFQRTLVSVGGLMQGFAEIMAAEVPSADQMIVWVPPQRGLRSWLLRSQLHQERQSALRELLSLHLRCYGNGCTTPFTSPLMARSIVDESGLLPEDWRLICPLCTSSVGPDLEPVRPIPIIKRWIDAGRTSLENPAASASFRTAPSIKDLPEWIQKNDPSHLELAYLGQQIWPSIGAMLDALNAIT